MQRLFIPRACRVSLGTEPFFRIANFAVAKARREIVGGDVPRSRGFVAFDEAALFWDFVLDADREVCHRGFTAEADSIVAIELIAADFSRVRAMVETLHDGGITELAEGELDIAGRGVVGTVDILVILLGAAVEIFILDLPVHDVATDGEVIDLLRGFKGVVIFAGV